MWIGLEPMPSAGLPVEPYEPLRVERPEAGRVLRATGVAAGVVEVGQAEVVAELVAEDADAAVLGLDGVVADPEVRCRRSGRRRAVWAGAGRADAVVERVPAVAPDGVGALGAAAGLLARPAWTDWKWSM